MNALSDLIRAEIAAQGPLRFDRFMALALEHPAHGYYAGERLIGRTGDFYTSVSVGPLFGRLLARQFEQMAGHLGDGGTFWIVEQGAHDGRLAADILDWLREHAAGLFSCVRYAIVEPMARSRARQQETLRAFAKNVQGFASLAELAAAQPVGVFFSNELVDAFPVRVVRRVGDRWCERCVTAQGDELTWCDAEITDEALRAATLSLPAIPGYTTEIHLAARAWMGEVARTLARGYVVTIDYGYPASLYYAPFRSQGTLTAYRGHRRGADVLAHPGEQDITAHVDFTALVRAGEDAGLAPLGWLDQQRFLMGIAENELAGTAPARLGLAQCVPAWQTLIHPSHLGASFHVLVQAKNGPPAPLDGLRFARPGGWD
jgi:SAM-dependent MidA family methyltransferase